MQERTEEPLREKYDMNIEQLVTYALPSTISIITSSALSPMWTWWDWSVQAHVIGCINVRVCLCVCVCVCVCVFVFEKQETKSK